MGVAVGETDAVAVGVADGETDAVAVGEALAVAVGVAVALNRALFLATLSRFSATGAIVLLVQT